MHGAVLIAIFGFCLAISLGARRAPAARRRARARRGAAWPATLVTTATGSARGALILAAVLALLAWGGAPPGAVGAAGARSPAPRSCSPRSPPGASPRSRRASSSRWKGWDPYDQPADPVGVRLRLGRELRRHRASRPSRRRSSRSPGRSARSTGARRRSTCSGAAAGSRRRRSIAVSDGAQDLSNDPLLPAARAHDRAAGPGERGDRGAAGRPSRRAERRRSPTTRAASARSSTGTATSRSSTAGSSAGDEYTVWSYAPRPRPRQLAQVRAGAGPAQLAPVGLPRGAAGRRRRPVRRRGTRAADPGAAGERGARDDGAPLPSALPPRAAGDRAAPRRQYAAVIALEAWFRSRGGFVYDESAAGLRRRCAAARRLRRADEGRVLPALRRGDDAHAALPRDPGPRRRRLHARRLRRGRPALDGDRPRRARVGRGLVRGLGLAAVRPDADARRRREPVQHRVGDPVGADRDRGPLPVGAASRRSALGSARRERRWTRGATSRAISAARSARRREGAGACSSCSARSRSSLLAAVAAAKLGRRRLRYLTRDPRRTRARACGRSSRSSSSTRACRCRAARRRTSSRPCSTTSSGSTAPPSPTRSAAARFGPPDRAADAARDARRELESIRAPAAQAADERRAREGLPLGAVARLRRSRVIPAPSCWRPGRGRGSGR